MYINTLSLSIDNPGAAPQAYLYKDVVNVTPQSVPFKQTQSVRLLWQTYWLVQLTGIRGFNLCKQAICAKQAA